MQQFGRSSIGNKQLPVPNKLSHDKWMQHCHRLHLQKLDTIARKNIRTNNNNDRWGQKDHSGVTDPKRPEYGHLRENLKRAQLEDERFLEIERENRILLEKMSNIMHNSPGPFDKTVEFQPGLRINQHGYPVMDHYISKNTMLAGRAVEPKSLNRGYRRRELERITAENQSIVRRIQSRQPNYSHGQWVSERMQNEKYLSQISNFPNKYTLQYRLPALKGTTPTGPPLRPFREEELQPPQGGSPQSKKKEAKRRSLGQMGANLDAELDDGGLDANELQQVMKKDAKAAKEVFGTADAQQVMQAYDKDGDGMLDEKELAAVQDAIQAKMADMQLVAALKARSKTVHISDTAVLGVGDWIKLDVGSGTEENIMIAQVQGQKVTLDKATIYAHPKGCVVEKLAIELSSNLLEVQLQDAAATRIQSRYRGKHARGEVSKRRDELEEQLKMVQSMGGDVPQRMSLVERQVQVQKELDEMEQAALKIQTMNRGKKARGDVAKKKEVEDAKRQERLQAELKILNEINAIDQGLDQQYRAGTPIELNGAVTFNITMMQPSYIPAGEWSAPNNLYDASNPLKSGTVMLTMESMQPEQEGANIEIGVNIENVL